MTALELLQNLNLLDETKGSGIRVMRDTMEQAGLTPPLFESDRGLSKVDTLAASATLRRLRDAGLLVQKGRGSATATRQLNGWD